MVLMRGAPGSGKSTLARRFVDEAVAGSPHRQHIFSADDYFVRRNGRYVFAPADVPAAHQQCQQLVARQAQQGWSPLCVDNTHMQLWEMHEYVHIAARYGYVLRLLEPTVAWRRAPMQLAQRNTHGVPYDKIVAMLARYQKCDGGADALMAECGAKYWMAMPQMRRWPERGTAVGVGVRPVGDGNAGGGRGDVVRAEEKRW